MARSHHTQACGGCRTLWVTSTAAPSGKKMGFHHIILFLIVSSSIIDGVCSQDVGNLSLVTLFFTFGSLSYH
jgi:hypothetical protein